MLTAIVPIIMVGTEKTMEVKISMNLTHLSIVPSFAIKCSREYSSQLWGTTMMNHVR